MLGRYKSKLPIKRGWLRVYISMLSKNLIGQNIYIDKLKIVKRGRKPSLCSLGTQLDSLERVGN